jgi:AmmeMemoRadiSam system protein A
MTSSTTPKVNPASFARACVEAFVRGEAPPSPPAEPFYERRAACFVSIKRRNGDLRGCIGTLEPTAPSLGDEIIHNAAAAAFRDPRFYPVRPDELPDLTYSVDVLSPHEPATIEQLDPQRYGVIVAAGARRGVLLPDLPTVRTVGEQVAIALQKAGIAPSEPFQLARFTVDRYRESEDVANGCC